LRLELAQCACLTEGIQDSEESALQGSDKLNPGYDFSRETLITCNKEISLSLRRARELNRIRSLQ